MLNWSRLEESKLTDGLPLDWVVCSFEALQLLGLQCVLKTNPGPLAGLQLSVDIESTEKNRIHAAILTPPSSLPSLNLGCSFQEAKRGVFIFPNQVSVFTWQERTEGLGKGCDGI